MTDHPSARMVQAASWIAAIPDWIGRIAAWLCLGMAGLCFAIVVLRYGFNLGWVAMQEGLVAANAAMFMLGLAWVLGADGHVRVDVFYGSMPPSRQAWMNLVGTLLFLWPLCGFIFVESLDYVAASWRVHEGSREPGGLPGVYLIKTLIPVAAGLLVLQSLAIAVRMVVQIRTEQS